MRVVYEESEAPDVASLSGLRVLKIVFPWAGKAILDFLKRCRETGDRWLKIRSAAAGASAE